MDLIHSTQPVRTTNRCEWCGKDPLYIKYHDEEWGVPEFDERRLFAKLLLDGAQAGLSWITILRKKENYYQAFDQFDPEKIARYDDKKRLQLLSNPGIIRNRLKVESAITNAQALLKLKSEGTNFSEFLWDFVGGEPKKNLWKSTNELPVKTSESETMSKILKENGFRFVGPTICYAFMQAVGMVNDHLVSCFRYEEL